MKMKKTTTTALLLLMAAVAQAQPTITTMHDYTVGTVIRIKICDMTNIAPGGAGPAQLWDFSALITVDSATERYDDPSMTPFVTNFPTANLVKKDDNGNFTYIEKTSTTGQRLGIADSFSGNLLIYTDPILMAKKPIMYQDMAHDTFWTLSATNNLHGSLQMEADGWGSLILPNGSYSNVLRIKTTYHEIDTLNSAPNPITGEIFATTYLWFDNNHSAPLLTWDSTHYDVSIGNFSMKTVSYLHDPLTTGIRKLSQSLSFSGSLQGEALYLRGDFKTDRKYQIQVMSMDGKTVAHYEASGGPNPLKLAWNNSAAQGTYLLFIHDDKGNFGTAKLLP